MKEEAQQYLRERGVLFVAKNSGAHLVVDGPTGAIDYWPTTGKWSARGQMKGQGITSLMNFLRESTRGFLVDYDLLLAIQQALNTQRNVKLPNQDFPDTYSVAYAIDKIMRHLK